VEVVHLLFFGLTTSFLWSTPSSWHFACSSMDLVALGFIHVGWLHASCGSLTIFEWLLWNILLGGLFYCFISHAPWRVHFVSFSRWILEHILLS
jgi:hypothetical protein